MDPLEGTWELAESEELIGDSLFFTGQPGAAGHYQAAQRALMPLGVLFTSREENDRRMEAFQRIVTKLYGIGGDGMARSSHDGQPHPNYIPPPPPPPVEPPADIPVIPDLVEAPVEPPAQIPLTPALVKQMMREAKARAESELGKTLTTDNWWIDYRVATLWFEAAKILGPNYPTEARAACDWSLDHYNAYGEAWSAHLPASRWDSDGGWERCEVSDFKKTLSPEPSSSTAPEWIGLLIAGDWRKSLAATEGDETAKEFQPMIDILTEASKAAGSGV
jgi:hypothetical protein